MNVDNKDWLDDRLAMKDYIPDDGFTSQVMERLPRKRLATITQARRLILGLSVAVAFCLFVHHLLLFIPFLLHSSPLLGYYLSSEFLGRAMALFRQPMVLYGTAGGIVVLGFAAIPFLRRWA